MASLGKLEGVHVDTQAVDDMENQKGSEKQMQKYQDRFDMVVRKVKMSTTGLRKTLADAYPWDFPTKGEPCPFSMMKFENEE